MNKASEDKIYSFLRSLYSTKFLCLQGDNYKIIAVRKTKFKGGIHSMHCFTFFTVNGFMYKNVGIPAMPLTLFPLISKCKVHDYHPEINAISFTLWFKDPLVADSLGNLDRILPKSKKSIY